MNTTYFLNIVAGNVIGTQKTTPIPTSYYIGLSSTEPTISGTNVTEPTGGAYARLQLTALSAPTGGVITNTQNISFPESIASWGTMTHFVIFDALTGGNLLMYGALSSSKTVDSETIVTIKQNGLTLTFGSEE